MPRPSSFSSNAPPYPPGLPRTLDRRLEHILVIGKTGSGKSTLLKDLCLHDAHEGNGFLLIDPHGDLAEEILAQLPKHRKNDIVHFNATDPGSCPGLNPFRSVDPF